MEIPVRRSTGLQLALEVLSRRRWLALLTFGCLFSAVISISIFLPDLYQSNTTVLIERQQIPETFVKSTATSAVETRLQTMSEKILSRSRLEELINRYDLYATLKQGVPLEEVAGRFRREILLNIKRVEQMGPNLAAVSFSISYTGLDPQKVAVVTNAIASLYVEENTQSRERQATETTQFLASKLEEVKEELSEQERQLSKVKEREAHLAMLAGLNTQLRQNSDALTRVSERRAGLARQLVELERQAGRGTAIGPDGKPATVLHGLTSASQN